MNIVEKAIKNNEIKFLLEETNGYKLTYCATSNRLRENL